MGVVGEQRHSEHQKQIFKLKLLKFS